MDSVVHFELPADDGKRSSEFYSKVFGWKTTQLGAEMGEYIVVETGPTDEKNNMAERPGFINGGIFKKSKPEQGVSVVIAVEDINAAMKKVTDAGGTALGGQVAGVPDDIPGIGLYAAFIDTEGNRMGMLQPKGM